MTDKRIIEKRLRQQKETAESLLAERCLPRFAARHISHEGGLAVLTGPRGSGKTFLALHLLQERDKKYAYADLSALGAVGSDEASLNALFEVLCIVYGEFEWLLIDEFLSNGDWERIIRYFRTMGVKVFAVASGRLPDTALSLAGVASVLYPLSFSEYCLWHDVCTEPKSPVEMASLRLAFDDFSMRGGIPSNQFRTRVKSNSRKIADTILENDLRGEIRKSNRPAITEIGRYLLTNSPVNLFFNDIAERFSLRSEITAKKYLGIIKGSAGVYALERFAFQEKIRDYGERIFAADPGFCEKSHDMESRLKIIVYMQLRRFCERHGYQMHYYGNRDLECDFVLCHEMKMRTIIQVIYDYSDSQAIKEKVASLIALSSASGCGKLFILTDNCHDTIETKGLSIYVKPAYEFLLDRSHMII